MVIGNHLVQHEELSLLAIGLGCHIQSLPTGAGADIKSLTAHRLAAQLPPPPPFRTPVGPPPPRYEVRNYDCGFRAPETEDRCRDCRTAARP
ncbi:hypothetical protein LKM28_14870 [Streptomyces sp. CT1-17]|uniref:hypothetical protein n=1 Tax=Streptomyces sp. CT1-17 TaxID=2885642 RepID=UPI001D104866|nr:hypothetical protein [Streptomyces sp. CT1-17]MCC2267582.1 hypothetical protein [Streptomyces sp. CT1-17]